MVTVYLFQFHILGKLKEVLLEQLDLMLFVEQEVMLVFYLHQ